jgi:2-oxo-4-hydroxy-4-carboxy--5-ureidoimidazoline (OHCU) decarboxylase
MAVPPFADADALHKRMVEVVRMPRVARSTILSVRTLILPERLRSRRNHGCLEARASGFRTWQPYEGRIRAVSGAEYRKAKFGFPFIMAVRGSNKTDLLAGFAERLKNSPDQEFECALGESQKSRAFGCTS